MAHHYHSFVGQVGEDDCRTPEISSKPLLLYNRSAGQAKPVDAASDKDTSSTTSNISDEKRSGIKNGAAGISAAPPTTQVPAFIPLAEQTG